MVITGADGLGFPDPIAVITVGAASAADISLESSPQIIGEAGTAVVGT